LRITSVKILVISAYYFKFQPRPSQNLLSLKFGRTLCLNFKMNLVLGSRSQVRTLQEREVPKALKIKCSERVRIIYSCLTKKGCRMASLLDFSRFCRDIYLSQISSISRERFSLSSAIFFVVFSSLSGTTP